MPMNRVLTIRLSEEDAAILERMKSLTGERTATGAIREGLKLCLSHAEHERELRIELLERADAYAAARSEVLRVSTSLRETARRMNSLCFTWGRADEMARLNERAN